MRWRTVRALRSLQEIQSILASTEDPIRVFPAVVAALNEHVPLVAARLTVEGRRDGASWGTPLDSTTVRCSVGDHAVLDVEPRAPLDEEGHILLEGTAAALALALAAEGARERTIEARRRLEEILAVVCHDLRLPLGTIFLTLGLLERTQRGESRGGREMGTIQFAAEQIDRFIEDLVELRRIECGVLALARNLQDVATLVQEVTTTERSRVIERRTLQLDADVAPDLPPLVVDRARILRTITRLIEHAARWTPRGSRIRLSVREVAGTVTFMVEAPSPHELDEADLLAGSGKTPGTGFALAIAARVVHDHGGRIFASARDGTIRLGFSLPAAEAEREAA